MRTALQLLLEPIHSSLGKEGFRKIRKADRLYQRLANEEFKWIGIHQRQDVALDESFQWISTQKREDFSLGMVRLLLKMRLSTDAICAALLYHPVKIEKLTIQEVQEQFGETVAILSENLNKLPSFSFPELISYEEEKKNSQLLVKEQAKSFSRMLLAMTKDLRVVLLKFAESLQSLRMLPFKTFEDQFKIAYECRRIYAPLANRLGISWIKNEMEDLTLRYLHPRPFYYLVKRLSATQKERESYIREVTSILRSMTKDLGIPTRVMGRSKHINSIYLKMKKRGVSYDELYDITAFRLICQTKDQCYQLLGAVHERWKPIPNRFKDYIALPKANMYQSLHTTVLGPQNKQIEIQIRTEKMHEFAEEGIAAHWLYKEGQAPQHGEMDQFQWLRNLLRLKDEKDDDQVFMASVRDYLEEGEVFVFTPKRHVKELPKGATPVDLAYSIHTDIGHRCIGAKVNKRIVPLRYKLQNGDLVEILTSNSSAPKRDWLQFVVTHRAKSKIRAFFRIEQRKEAIVAGRAALEKALPDSHRSLIKLQKSGAFDPILKKVNSPTFDEMLVNIGIGKLDPKTVVAHLFPSEQENKQEEEEEIFFISPPQTKQTQKGILVDGLGDILVQMAGCCHPIPGDPIVGFVSRGRGVIVHRKNCPTIREIEPERLIPVRWDASGETKHIVILKVLGENHGGLLTNLSRVFTDLKIDIAAAHCEVDGDEAINFFTCHVTDTRHLQRLIRGLESVKGVLSVTRVRN